MGLFDFFRKIKKKKIKESKIEQEKIIFSEIEKWIENKIKESEIKEKKVFVLIQEKINVIIDELKEKIKVVEDVDIEPKKVEGKIKFVVNEGRKKYIESLESFIEKLENLEREKLGKFIEGVNKISLDFNKSSHMSYERATILIGKEMACIKECLKVFSRDLIKIFEENKELVEWSKKIPFIKLKLNQIAEIDRILEKVNETIMYLDKKIIDEKQENKKILEQIEKIKNSEDHVKNLERQEKIKLSEEELEKELIDLKQVIDFKSLANFFHIFKEQMDVVKSHKEDFQTSFQKDNGERILGLLNEAKLNNENISDKIKQINNKKEEITKNKQEIKKDETQELYSITTKIILEIGNLNNEKNREEKRREKLKEIKKEIIEGVKKELEMVGVEVVN